MKFLSGAHSALWSRFGILLISLLILYLAKQLGGLGWLAVFCLTLQTFNPQAVPQEQRDAYETFGITQNEDRLCNQNHWYIWCCLTFRIFFLPSRMVFSCFYPRWRCSFRQGAQHHCTSASSFTERYKAISLLSFTMFFEIFWWKLLK